MRAIVDALPDLIRHRLESIWCDSKCTCNYRIATKRGRYAPAVPDAIDLAVVSACGGHNGLIVQGTLTGEYRVLDPLWPGPDDGATDEGIVGDEELPDEILF